MSLKIKRSEFININISCLSPAICKIVNVTNWRGKLKIIFCKKKINKFVNVAKFSSEFQSVILLFFINMIIIICFTICIYRRLLPAIRSTIRTDLRLTNWEPLVPALMQLCPLINMYVSGGCINNACCFFIT